MGALDKLITVAVKLIAKEIKNNKNKAITQNPTEVSKNSVKVIGSNTNSNNSSYNTRITRLPTEMIDRTVSTGEGIERKDSYFYFSDNLEVEFEVSFIVNKDFILDNLSSSGVEIGLVYGKDLEDFSYSDETDITYIMENPVIALGGENNHVNILANNITHDQDNITICNINDEIFAAKTTYTTDVSVNMAYFWRAAPDEHIYDWVIFELMYPIEYKNTEFEKEILASYLEAVGTFKAKRIK